MGFWPPVYTLGPRIAQTIEYRQLTGGLHGDKVRASKYPPNAQVVELVDTLASGASARKGVEVQVLFWAPLQRPSHRPTFLLAPSRTLNKALRKRAQVECGMKALRTIPAEQQKKLYSSSIDLDQT